jgi:hypothetical protein
VKESLSPKKFFLKKVIDLLNKSWIFNIIKSLQINWILYDIYGLFGWFKFFIIPSFTTSTSWTSRRSLRSIFINSRSFRIFIAYHSTSWRKVTKLYFCTLSTATASTEIRITLTSGYSQYKVLPVYLILKSSIVVTLIEIIFKWQSTAQRRFLTNYIEFLHKKPTLTTFISKNKSPQSKI